MAITAAAGPLSNLLLALLFAGLMRLVMIPLEDILIQSALSSVSYSSNTAFLMLSLFVVLCYIGIILNLSLMIFNLIPLPPLDGSRIAYVFLPSKIYFGIMKYERYIMIGFLLLLYGFNFLNIPNPITSLVFWMQEGLFRLFGISDLLFSISYLEIFSRFSF